MNATRRRERKLTLFQEAIKVKRRKTKKRILNKQIPGRTRDIFQETKKTTIGERLKC